MGLRRQVFSQREAKAGLIALAFSPRFIRMQYDAWGGGGTGLLPPRYGRCLRPFKLWSFAAGDMPLCISSKYQRHPDQASHDAHLNFCPWYLEAASSRACKMPSPFPQGAYSFLSQARGTHTEYAQQDIRRQDSGQLKVMLIRIWMGISTDNEQINSKGGE